MLSSDYPILEFDENREALIRPEFLKNRYEPISERLLICFFHETIEKLLEREEIVLHFVLRGENPLKIYRFLDQDITLVEGRLGAPAAGGSHCPRCKKDTVCGWSRCLKKRPGCGKVSGPYFRGER